VTNLE